MVGKVAVAINVNVGKESVVAFDVDGSCLVVLTIGEGWCSCLQSVDACGGESG